MSFFLHNKCLKVQPEQCAGMSGKALLERIQEAVAFPDAIVKADGMKRTLKVDLDPLGLVCLQEFNWDVRRRLFSLGMNSRGARVWQYSCALSELGIAIAEPLFFLEERCFGFLHRTYLGMRWLENVTCLSCLAKESSNGGQDKDLLGLLGKSIDMIAKMHNGGFVHGDLKWSNLFYTNDVIPRPLLLDLDGLRPSGSSRKQGQDFARFVFSAMEYSFDEVVTENLVEHYLCQRQRDSTQAEKSLRATLERKASRYYGRRSG